MYAVGVSRVLHLTLGPLQLRPVDVIARAAMRRGLVAVVPASQEEPAKRQKE